MKFFIENKELDKELEMILNQIKLRMNGTTVGQMEGRGIKYRVNYGVGFPHLKEIASSHNSDYNLAERLWLKEIRETMLLGAMLVPQSEMTIERCREWSQLITNIDLVERTSMVLWGHLPIAEELVNEWKCSENQWLKLLANYTKGWSVQYTNKCTELMIDELISEDLTEADYGYLKSVAFAIKKMLRVLGKSTVKLKGWIEEVNCIENKGLQLIVQDVIGEIEFVEDK
ncbi:DNA alkylation repair protein [Carboxylicivirga linearis]|uniref:DNA alkylation repair protein n=1 Tax=Carboxylicivirga linearis TaxID=1628157 RepID=A0ABS5JPX2_9BACT|nr:DNA alkylation repair protein [Carboxylicivirga linearis]MBS2096864.1 DNA alkylation repair protein [Carboxylicivirga linearis]